ncbi:hypothetical protein GF337_16955 [candidate division KSB1 bacterium]|nr:hypothetical protein [candidate division KSB1 bacterium]
MVFSYYLYKYPYKLGWYFFRLLKKNPDFVVYLADPLDYVVLKPIIKHLPPVEYACKNRKTRKYLDNLSIPNKRLPSFPKTVLMCRHAAHKFSVRKIQRFGCRHGAYHFKEFTHASSYNAFNLYFVTSRKEVEIAEANSISSTRAIGFPKLDPAFDGTLNESTLKPFRKKAKLDPRRKTLIFTTTWDNSGMSAIERWIDELPSLANVYNVLVTVHPWMSSQYIDRLRGMSDIYFIEEPDALPYLMLADVMIADHSSIIAEFCALDKPIITFATPQQERSPAEIRKLLKNISIRVNNFTEMRHAIETCLANPAAKQAQRQAANSLMFDQFLDGNAGKRVAEMILREINEKSRRY